MIKFNTEFQYAGVWFVVVGTISSDNEIEVDCVKAYTGKDYVELEVETDLFLNTMEDYIRESVEQDAAAAREAYYEDKYDEEKLEV